MIHLYRSFLLKELHSVFDAMLLIGETSIAQRRSVWRMIWGALTPRAGCKVQTMHIVNLQCCIFTLGTTQSGYNTYVRTRISFTTHYLWPLMIMLNVARTYMLKRTCQSGHHNSQHSLTIMLLRNKKVQKILFLKKAAYLTNQTIVSKILF